MIRKVQWFLMVFLQFEDIIVGERCAIKGSPSPGQEQSGRHHRAVGLAGRDAG
jgi:hypothetical protein